MEVYQIESDDLSRISEQELTSEKSLENYLIRSDGAQIGGVDVLYIDQQGSPGEGGIFDIIGVDEQGNVVIIELKRGQSPRDIVAQALEYAASIRSEDYDQLEARYRDFVDDEDISLRAKHSEFFNRNDVLSQREFNTDQRLLLVGGDFSGLSLDMADFLREHRIDVICVTYDSFATEHDSLQLLTTNSVRRPLSLEPASVSGGGSPRGSIVEILDGEGVIKTFEESTQTEVMESVTEYLIREHSLIDGISVPYIPGRGDGDRALINSQPTHVDGAKMGSHRKLESGHYLFTKLNAPSKTRYINELAQQCGLNARCDL